MSRRFVDVCDKRTGAVIHRIEVHQRNDAARVARGVNINLDRSRYETRLAEADTILSGRHPRRASAAASGSGSGSDPDPASADSGSST